LQVFLSRSEGEDEIPWTDKKIIICICRWL